MIGQQVTCKHPVEAYYSNYGLNKGVVIEFKPGMSGIVKSVSPKVCLPAKGGKLPPGIDRKLDSVIIDFNDELGHPQRCSLNFCNIQETT